MVFKKFRIGIICICFLLLPGISIFAQSHTPTKSNDFQKFAFEFENDRISSAQYLDSIQMLINLSFSKGITFETKDLIKKLELYRKIAFETEKNEEYAGKYYTILANNAQFRNKEGEAIFFLEKSVKLGHQQDIHAINVLATKCRFYADNDLFKQAAAVYEKDSVLVNKVISVLLSDTNKGYNNINIFYLLSFISHTYANLGDKSKNSKIIYTALKLKDKFEAMVGGKNQNSPVINFFVGAMEYYQAETLEKDYQKAAKIIKQIQGDLDNAINLTFEWRVMLQSNIDNMKTSLFLLTKQNDSARVYIAK